MIPSLNQSPYFALSRAWIRLGLKVLGISAITLIGQGRAHAQLGAPYSICDSMGTEKVPGGGPRYIPQSVKEYIAPIDAPNKPYGYRLLVTGGANRESAYRLRTQLTEMFPDDVAYVTYVGPYFKVTLGDYRHPIEAISRYLVLKPNYPEAQLVPERIELPPLPTQP